MKEEYSGGGVLIFSYLILIHQLDDLGGFCDNFDSVFIGCRFDGPPAHRPIQSEFHRPPTSTLLHISTSMQQLELVNVFLHTVILISISH